MKLKAKLSLLLLPLVTTPLLAVGVAAYLQLTDISKQRNQQQVHTLFDMYQSQVDNIARTARSNLHLFSDYPLIKQYFLADTEEERYLVLYLPVQRQLYAIQKNYPEYYELRLLLPDGFEDLRMINRSLPNHNEMELNSSALKELLANESDISSRVDRSPDNNELALYVTKRITMINEAIEDPGTVPRLRGYFGITIDIDFLLRQVTENVLGNNSGLVLTNDTGSILYLAAPIQKLSEELHQVFTKTFDTASGDLQLPSGGFRLSSRQLHNNLWVHALIAEQDLREASRGLNRTITWITFVALAASLSLIFIGLSIQVIGPLTRLRKGILDLSDGNELVQIPIHSRDELGDLAQEFNRMGRALQQSNEQIRSMAYSDYLTELPNRFQFHKTLSQAMDVALRKNRQLGLIFIDLDNFKNINDTLGHQTGDRLLKSIAQRLQNNLRGIDVSGPVDLTPQEHNLARLGGDEFTVIIQGFSSVMDLNKVATRLIAAIERPFIHQDTEHFISASVGIAVFPSDGDNPEELIKNADMAMYEAKKLGKGRFEFFSTKISRQVLERTHLERRLRIALEQENFELHYQPILNNKTRNIALMEALIRWDDDELGSVAPGYFIPVAEEAGLINAIGAWVLNEACRQLRVWHDQGINGLKVAINVSGKQLEKPEFAEQVLTTLKHHDIRPESIHLELTESAVIQGETEVIATLSKLRKIGARIALDDFGTGYSSLSYLRNLPIDVLKIDRRFIQGLGQQNNNIILSAIITMAQAMNLQVIAEGVETQGQFAFLQKEHCNMLQGYLFYRPESTVKISAKLTSGELHFD